MSESIGLETPSALATSPAPESVAPVPDPKPAKARKAKPSTPTPSGSTVVLINLAGIHRAVQGDADYDPRQAMPLDAGLVASMKGHGWDPTLPGIVRRSGKGFVFVNGRTRTRAAEKAGLTEGWFLVLPENEEAAHADHLSRYRANASVESDPWTRAESYVESATLGFTEEEIAEASKVSKAVIGTYVALYYAVTALDDKRAAEVQDLLRTGKVSVRQILDAYQLSESEKVEALDRAVKRAAQGLSTRSKPKASKPSSSALGLTKAQTVGLIEQVEKMDLKGAHGLAVKNAAIAALQCVTGAKDHSDLADALDALAKARS